MILKEVASQYRPREKLQKYGVTALTDAEVLALIFKTGTRNEHVVTMSERVLSSFENISKCSLEELQTIKGVGLAKAAQVLACFELVRRQERKEGKVIISPQEVFDYMKPKIGHLDREHFYLLHLDVKKRVIKEELVAIGVLDGVLLHPREVFKSAIKSSTHSLILVHNHPSGDCTPSEEDLVVTKKLVEGGKILNIPVLDHVIVGDDWWGWK